MYAARSLRATLAAALTVATAAAAHAQPPATPAAKGVETTSVRTKDGWTLPVTYFRSGGGKDSPVVVLLHGAGGNRLVWGNERGGFAKRLHDAGFAVVTVDLRKHGEAQPPATGGPTRGPKTAGPIDFPLMAAMDLEAVKDFLVARHQAEELNVRKTGILAADETAPVAAAFAEADWIKPPHPDAPLGSGERTPRGQDIRALALLSPAESAGRINMGRVLPTLKNVKAAVFVAVAAEDRADKGTAAKVYERLLGPESEERRVFLQKYDTAKARGTELLGTGDVESKLIVFFTKYLKDLPDTWQDRKSRLAK